MDFDGINIYLVSEGETHTIPPNAMNRCVIVETNQNNQPVRAHYHDILGETSINPSLIQMQAITNAANTQKVNLDARGPHLLYASPQTLENILPIQNLKNYPVTTTRRLVGLYFMNHPDKQKLSRKASGLPHSYVQGKPGDITELANKDECRVAWLSAPPTPDAFLNLPENTSAVYAVVPSLTDGAYDIYYLEKGATQPAVKVDNTDDVRSFEPFKLNNRGLSKEELQELHEAHEHKHAADSEHVLGEGGFGRVKQSRSISPEQRVREQATKAQRISSPLKLQTKLQGRAVEIQAMKDEASIAEDLNAGSSTVSVTDNKAYMHMDNLGKPLANKTRNASCAKRVGWAIKALQEAHNINTGDASKRGIPYAHRDIKLANFVVNPKTEEVRLIDYGLTTTNLTNKKEKAGGTLYYAPLDQALINEYLAKGKQTSTNQKQSSPSATDKSGSSSSSDNSDDVELVSDYWGGSVEESLPSFNPGDSIHIEAENRELNWQFKLKPGGPCLTENYLEDDKVAMLRTLYCNPEPANPNSDISIFDKETFEQLPKPIQRILDTTTIAPLLTDERKNETLGFFEAVLIDYQAHPNLSDEAYEQRIHEIRHNQGLQQSLINNYTEQEPTLSEINFSDNTSEEANTLTQSSDDDLNFIPASPGKKIKTKPEADNTPSLKKRVSSFLGFKSRSASISPITDDESLDNDLDKKNKPSPRR